MNIAKRSFHCNIEVLICQNTTINGGLFSILKAITHYRIDKVTSHYQREVEINRKIVSKENRILGIKHIWHKKLAIGILQMEEIELNIKLYKMNYKKQDKDSKIKRKVNIQVYMTLGEVEPPNDTIEG